MVEKGLREIHDYGMKLVEGIAKDDEESTKLYRKLAEIRDDGVMWKVGWVYDYGKEAQEKLIELGET